MNDDKGGQLTFLPDEPLVITYLVDGGPRRVPNVVGSGVGRTDGGGLAGGAVMPCCRIR